MLTMVGVNYPNNIGINYMKIPLVHYNFLQACEVNPHTTISTHLKEQCL